MEKKRISIEAHIESGSDGLYSIYIEDANVLPFGVIGTGKTIDEAKNDFEAVFREAAATYVEEDGGDILYIPEITYIMDLTALLVAYRNVLSLGDFAKITGINKGLLSHYLTGHRIPKPETVERIKRSVVLFAEELKRMFS